MRSRQSCPARQALTFLRKFFQYVKLREPEKHLRELKYALALKDSQKTTIFHFTEKKLFPAALLFENTL